jgi:hypothetical protein
VSPPRLWPLGLVGFVLLTTAVVAGLVFGTDHAYAGCAATALALVPAGVTVWATGRLARRTKFAGLVGMAAGTILRTVVAVGGGAALFFAIPAFREMRYGFWGWIVATYLAMLAVETATLARYFWVGSAVGRGNAA